MSEKQKRAFLNVSDKTGIVDLAQGLKELGWELLASGGTAKTLKQFELEISELSPAPGVPAALEPKLRLLQPGLMGAALADRWKPPEAAAAEKLGQAPLDLVAINLYPLSQVLEQSSLTQREVMEYVDVSASAALRAAARNFAHVIVLCDPVDYAPTVETLREFGDLPPDQRQNLAAKAFHAAAYYDSMIAQYLTERPQRLPDELVMGLKKLQELSYGENPQQRAAVYALSGARSWGLAAAKLLHGKPLSFNHYLDLETAWELAAEFEADASALVKHTHPCGAATADRLAEAFRLAFLCDPQSAHGGVAAFNRPVDEEAARLVAEQFLECVVAPDFSQEALEILRLKKDMRLLTLPSTLVSPNEIQIHCVSGGLLVEAKNNQTFGELKPVTKRAPSEPETTAARFAWRVAKHAKTYALVLAKGTQTVGIGAGQPSRLDAMRVAIAKANERHPIFDPKKPLVLACDGPLPLRCLHEAAAAGVSTIIQSGGSSEDRETIRACDSKQMAMLFAGMRHYRH